MTLDEALHRNAELGAQVQRLEEELKVAQLTIEKLKAFHWRPGKPYLKLHR
jgi:hypothetical protein